MDMYLHKNTTMMSALILPNFSSNIYTVLRICEFFVFIELVFSQGITAVQLRMSLHIIVKSKGDSLC